jgi:hypothetical protein
MAVELRLTRGFARTGTVWIANLGSGPAGGEMSASGGECQAPVEF